MLLLGLDPTVEAELVIYRVEPVDGAHAGTRVATGVAVDELGHGRTSRRIGFTFRRRLDSPDQQSTLN